jgi:cell division protein FtsB
VSVRAHRAGTARRPARARPSYRLAPRRSSRGRPRSRIDWDRLGRITLVLVLFVILVLYVNPISNFLDAWQESKAEQERLADLRAENERLHRQAASLDDPETAVRQARRIGMVAPGERPYVVHGLGR